MARRDFIPVERTIIETTVTAFVKGRELGVTSTLPQITAAIRAIADHLDKALARPVNVGIVYSPGEPRDMEFAAVGRPNLRLAVWG